MTTARGPERPWIVDRGEGRTVVLVPGIQGRWEWMRPTVRALAKRCRVVTFSLCGERSSGCPLEARRGFDGLADQIDRAMDEAGLDRAAVCGVSFGGFIALRYAALRPGRTTGLILASTPAPGWRPDARVEGYLRAPRLTSPLFILRSPARLWPEIRAAFPTWRGRLRFGAEHTLRVAAAPFSPALMAERVRLASRTNFSADCARVACPTLVITGEPGLDRVVPVADTRQYARLIRGAGLLTLPRTGHIGLVTTPDAFAGAVAGFLERTR